MLFKCVAFYDVSVAFMVVVMRVVSGYGAGLRMMRIFSASDEFFCIHGCCLSGWRVLFHPQAVLRMMCSVAAQLV